MQGIQHGCFQYNSGFRMFVKSTEAGLLELSKKVMRMENIQDLLIRSSSAVDFATISNENETSSLKVSENRYSTLVFMPL